jgi:hypothetical protein
MDVVVSTGQWIAAIQCVMSGNADKKLCFVLPSLAHLHAFYIAKNLYPDSNFSAKLNTSIEANHV